MHVVGHDNVCVQHIVAEFAAPLDRTLGIPCDFAVAQPSRTRKGGVQPEVRHQELLTRVFLQLFHLTNKISR